MNTYMVTAKNVANLQPKEIFSDNMKAILIILTKMKHKDYSIRNHEFEVDYGNAIREYNNIGGLIPDMLTKDEIGLFSSYTYNKGLDEAYEEYVKDYKDSKQKLDEIFEVLDNNKNEEMYYRECPITHKKFNILKGKDVARKIRGYETHSYSRIPGMRDDKGHFTILSSIYRDSDELKISDRYHPDVVDRIKEEWDFESNLKIDETIKDGTALKFSSVDGAVQVAYNPNNNINNLNLQYVKVYTNKKGLYYKIRGRKRVYLDLSDVEIELR